MEVLILVLVDYALELVIIQLTFFNPLVLILVLVDYALEQK